MTHNLRSNIISTQNYLRIITYLRSLRDWRGRGSRCDTGESCCCDVGGNCASRSCSWARMYICFLNLIRAVLLRSCRSEKSFSFFFTESHFCPISIRSSILNISQHSGYESLQHHMTEIWHDHQAWIWVALAGVLSVCVFTCGALYWCRCMNRGHWINQRSRIQ